MLSPIEFPPYQGHCVDVAVIDGAKSHMLARMLLGSEAADGEHLHLAHHCFLIQSPHQNRKVLFDLAFMKDADTYMPPALKKLLSDGGEPVMGIESSYDVPALLQSHGHDLTSIESVIWSHAHWDHVGDPSAFPHSTDLIVGSGFKTACLPGYPTDSSAMVLDSAFQQRNVREIDFASTDLCIGGFRATDYFGDGSFFLLETSGHTAYHLSALLRTTETSWVFAAGDACHSIAQLRPSIGRPLPETWDSGRRARDAPFYSLAPGMQEDMNQSLTTLERLMAFDGCDDVFVILAHDATLLDFLPVFPRRVNEWKAENLAAMARWAFLRDFQGVKGVPTN